MSGIAIKNISKIKKDNLYKTVNDLCFLIFSRCDISDETWCLLGSSGKKEVSGDIDIAVNYTTTIYGNKNDLASRLENVLTQLNIEYNNRVNTGFSMFHIGMPIHNMKDQICQVDLMFVTDLNYAQFKYHAPYPENSKYNGAMRSMLLNAFLKETTIKPGNNLVEDKVPYIVDGVEYSPFITYQHLSLSPYNIQLNTKTYHGKTGFLKNPKIINSINLGVNYKKIINQYCNCQIYDFDNVFDSFESIWNFIISNISSNIIKNIVKTFIRLFDGVNSWQYINENTLKLPIEIEQYVSTHTI